MFDANLLGISSGRKVKVRFHGIPKTGSPCVVDAGIYEAEVIVSGKSGYDSALIKVWVSDNLSIELKDIDVGYRIVSYEGEIDDINEQLQEVK